MTSDVYALANEWLRLDRNPSSRKQILDLVSAKGENELLRRLAASLSFGTAGLRAEMGAGTAFINDLTVIQTTQGLVSYILSTTSNDPTQCSVVIGFDHRAYNGFSSVTFAKLAASVFLSKQIKVYFYQDFVHTPLVPFGVTQLNATCGIMITASHNPKADNGYKLYWSNGSQIVSPIDTLITKSITENLEPWVWDEQMVDRLLDRGSPLITDPLESIQNAYMTSIKDLCKIIAPGPTTSDHPVQICYTAMHGVGYPYIRRAFQECGLGPFHLTADQVFPDPNFSTVKNPNPEEGKGALDLAIHAADSNQCQIILANDPDADRLAVAEKVDGKGWFLFTGNQIGIMLAAFLVRGYRRAFPETTKFACLTTIVSSMILKAFARAEGLVYEETLTGFKYLGNRGADMVANGEADVIMFAYEQAIGFMCGSAVMDKDGVSAGVCIGHLVQWLATQTEFPFNNLYTWLQYLYTKYGMYTSNDGYIIEPDSSKIETLFARIRPPSVMLANGDWTRVVNGSEPKPAYPTHVGIDFVVIGVRDLTGNYDSTTSDHLPTIKGDRPSSNLITFSLSVPERLCTHANIAFPHPITLTLRTSGTEPKVKWYSELAGLWKDAGGDEVGVERRLDLIQSASQRVLDELVEVIKREWLLVV